MIGDRKAAIEALTGINFVTGEELDATDRIISGVGAVVGVASFGTLGVAFRNSLKFGMKATKFKGVEDVFRVGSEIYDSARKLGHKTAEQVADFTDSIRRFAGNNIGAVGNIDEIAEASSIISKKADYILGKATGSAHNIERSKSMLRQMERIGLPDTSQTRGLLKDHLIKTLKDPTSIKDSTLEGGRVLRESLISGKNGHLKVESIWDGNKLITVKLKGGR